MDIIDHVAAALGPLACPSRGAWSPSRSARPHILFVPQRLAQKLS